MPILVLIFSAMGAVLLLAAREARSKAIAAAPGSPAAPEPWAILGYSAPGHEAFPDDPTAVPSAVDELVGGLVALVPSAQPTPDRPLTVTILPGKCSVCEVPAEAGAYTDAIRQAESRHGVPAYMLGRLLRAESNFDATARGAAGEIGIAQFMPSTAAELGVNPADPLASIDGAARYLRQLYDQHGSWDAALTAYNWGTGNVARQGVNSAPASTKAYVRSILGA